MKKATATTIVKTFIAATIFFLVMIPTAIIPTLALTYFLLSLAGTHIMNLLVIIPIALLIIGATAVWTLFVCKTYQAIVEKYNVKPLLLYQGAYQK